MRKSGSQGVLIGYTKVMQNIDSIFATRLENARKIFNITAREILRDFRAVQQNSATIEPQKPNTKNNKRKKKSAKQREDETNEKVREAIEYAKQHKNTVATERGYPWINRTKRAVRAVNAIVNADMDTISVQLSHGIYYGAYLEYAQNRKYAVLEPLIRQYTPQLMTDLKKVMGGGVV